MTYLQAVRWLGRAPAGFWHNKANYAVSTCRTSGFAGKLRVPVSELLEDCYALSRVFSAGWGHKGATS